LHRIILGVGNDARIVMGGCALDPEQRCVPPAQIKRLKIFFARGRSIVPPGRCRHPEPPRIAGRHRARSVGASKPLASSKRSTRTVRIDSGLVTRRTGLEVSQEQIQRVLREGGIVEQTGTPFDHEPRDAPPSRERVGPSEASWSRPRRGGPRPRPDRVDDAVLGEADADPQAGLGSQVPSEPPRELRDALLRIRADGGVGRMREEGFRQQRRGGRAEIRGERTQ